MSYEEYDEAGDDFRTEDDPPESLDMPEEMTDLDDDPEDRYH